MTSLTQGRHLPTRQIAILTGAPGSGKTTACCRLEDRARELGLDCAGIICPARFDDGARAGIDVVDARTRERRSLAEVDELPGRLRAGPYRFDDGAVAWGVARLGKACPCDLLIVDEIGLLEMDRGEGWVNALDVLRLGEYRLAVAVVRLSLLDAFRTAIGTPPSTELVGAWIVPGRDALRALFSLVEAAASSARQP